MNWHFVWPRHKNSTINTLWYSKYKDRIDYFLFDLKCYFAGQKTPMESAYITGTTPIWLSQFPDFVNRMQLQFFVNADYEVLDIASGKTQIVDHLANSEEIKASLKEYVSQLLTSQLL
ncbi:hypothetical protein MOO45_06295 [Bombilactobacillus folatiphilus]|uniref:Uncharacterized protein n=1 Tax=Bombilactobacillus folatiphilus TaxID=2923362 RepID=A0ABY4P883_9LACO|nr:hypothetical protein [Bombilactobacillus folatiphilus]UQS81810.1 hypothetical protein MOO45_06295 [Bombilactobacillus folatiphilus]